MIETTLLEVGGVLFAIIEDTERGKHTEACIDPDADLLEALDLFARDSED